MLGQNISSYIRVSPDTSPEVVADQGARFFIDQCPRTMGDRRVVWQVVVNGTHNGVAIMAKGLHPLENAPLMMLFRLGDSQEYVLVLEHFFAGPSDYGNVVICLEAQLDREIQRIWNQWYEGSVYQQELYREALRAIPLGVCWAAFAK